MSNPGSFRKYIFFAIFILVGSIFTLRLLFLQVIDDQYEIYARNNALHEVTIYPSRGLIRDRKGELLVFNDAIYDLMVIPNKVQNLDTNEFCTLLGMTREDFKARFDRLKKAKGWAPYRTHLFEKQLPAEVYAAFQEKLFDFRGFFVETRIDRNYKHRNAAHVLGYINEVTDREIEQSNGYYRQGDLTGITGIENAYEEILRGRKGKKYILVDNLNREQGRYKDGAYDSAATAGQDLWCTLDHKVQNLGEELMQNKIGSIVAIEPSTGELLAMVSSPGYDPNLFIGRARGNNYMKLLKDPLKPLFNRPLQAPYPPGSIFKIVMSLVGQQEGVLFPETLYPCHGGYNNGSNKVGCHPHGGPLDLKGAVQISCNSYFCHVFKSVIDNKNYRYTDEAFTKWRKYAESFGIGVRLGIELPQVSAGLLPKTAMYDKVYGKHHWKASTIISLAIGQGELGIIPLQMANVAAILANRGYYIDPHVARYIGPDKKPIEKYKQKHYTMVDRQYYDIVIQGMYDVVKGGTGIIAQIPGIEVCGKTGTAQNPHGKDHSVFIAFAPRENPKIAIAVVVENAGFGATWAAPIASLLMEQYLTDTVKRTYLVENMKKGNLIGNVLGTKVEASKDSLDKKNKPTKPNQKKDAKVDAKKDPDVYDQ
jgi:penicillin-binding protein 2